MIYRKIVSLSIALSFLVLSITGVLSYFYDYTRVLATIHTVFGFLFTIGIVLHLFNNLKPLSNYVKGKVIFPIGLLVAFVFSATYFQVPPFSSIMDFGAKLKASNKKGLSLAEHEVLEMDLSRDLELSIDLVRGEHYWHPQMAVWLEDGDGNFIETIYISKATAQGLFFGGRSKNNFKEFDAKPSASTDYRRVNALPVWSHKRGVTYDDGMYVPTRDKPLPDAITGATLQDNFTLLSSIDSLNTFNVKVEINVAFDDNEYYSEYDFPDDDTFHNGTGQLGQPSIIYHATVDLNDDKNYYLMDLMGHGHHSGQNGEVYADVSSLTTALDIVERIVVGVKEFRRT